MGPNRHSGDKTAIRWSANITVRSQQLLWVSLFYGNVTLWCAEYPRYLGPLLPVADLPGRRT